MLISLLNCSIPFKVSSTSLSTKCSGANPNKNLFEVVQIQDDTTRAPQQTETAPQREAREAREAQDRLEALRLDEERRRGRLWTEQDIINSIQVTDRDPAVSTNIGFNVEYNIKERLNDPDNIIRLTTSSISIYVYNSFSCGINQLTNVQAFLYSIHNHLDYQENDYEERREALFREIGRKFREIMPTKRDATWSLASVVDNDGDWCAEILEEYFGFEQLDDPMENPNSGNIITLLKFVGDL